MNPLLDTLLKQLKSFPPSHHYRVAYSGGCDSHVLLHALAAIRDHLAAPKLSALHINHGLADEADAWAAHCEKVAADLGIAIQIVDVDAMGEAGDSPEAAARQARYHAFEKIMQEGEGLLLAHHQDDQAETLLLQLFRGAGVRGLAAMPHCVTFSRGWLGRPLLGLCRQQLRDYAQAADLSWIEDPGNQSIDFDRNFLRHTVMPDLLPRWPALAQTLSRAAEHQASAGRLLDELAAVDLKSIAGTRRDCLSISGLRLLSRERQDNVLRYWIRMQGVSPPSTRQLQRLHAEVLAARDDAQPQLDWAGHRIRRYRDDLYLLPVQAPEYQSLYWDLNGGLNLPDGRCLSIKQTLGEGLQAALQGRRDIAVRFRQGGEVCRPAGRKQTHRLKTLYQEWGVPPWERERIPLIYVGEEIAQVVGYCVCEGWQAGKDEDGLMITDSRQA